MKLNRFVSAVSALALSVSLFSSLAIAEAASLGGQPEVKTEFTGYTTNTKKTWAKAWVKVTIDMSKAETLSAYSKTKVWDDDEEDYVTVITGNGIKTAGLTAMASNTAFDVANNDATAPTGWLLDKNAATGGYSVAFGPKTLATDYFVDEIAELVFCFKVTDLTQSATVSFSDYKVAGMDQNDGLWDYVVTPQAVSIPSYNEWSTPSTVAVTGVSIKDNADFTLDLNGETTKTLEAVVAPADATNKAVKWSSDNDKAATVVDGKVTAVGEGKAKISVTTVDGGFTDSVLVTVVAPKTKVDRETIGAEGAYDGKTLIKLGKIFKNAFSNSVIAVKNETTGETKTSSKTIAEILGGETVGETTIDVEITVGVLTDTPSDVFSFGLLN